MLTVTITSGTGFYCFGVFMEPIMEDFSWSKSQVTWIITIYWAVMALSAPIVGKVIDTYGVRKVMLGAALVNGICLLALYQANALWHFYLIYGIKAISHAGLGLIAIGAVVAIWFDKKRGRATGIATIGIGLGGLLLAPFAGFLIPIAGWRAVYLVLGILIWVIVLPTIAVIVKSSPEALGLLRDGEVRPTEAKNVGSMPVSIEIPLSRAIQTPAYWLISLAFFLGGAGLFGTLTHQTSFIEGIGISREAASLALGFTAGIGILGKIFFGFLAEKIQVRYVAFICFGFQAVGVSILMMTRSMAMVWLFVVVFGFAMGGSVTLRTLIIIEFFGTAAVGAILGSSSLIFALGAASGPIFAAYVFDFTQDYYWAFLSYIVIYGIAMGMVFGAPVVKDSLLNTQTAKLVKPV